MTVKRARTVSNTTVVGNMHQCCPRGDGYTPHPLVRLQAVEARVGRGCDYTPANVVVVAAGVVVSANGDASKIQDQKNDR